MRRVAKEPVFHENHRLREDLNEFFELFSNRSTGPMDAWLVQDTH